MRALFVVSTWQPHLLADVQRVRMLIPEMSKAGWEVEVMFPDATYQAPYSLDPDSPRFYPQTTEHPVGPWLRGLFEALGSRSIGIRAGVPLGRRGLELLRSRKYDVVYFSTTQHLLTCAGPCWRRKTGVPYVADVHDPIFIPKPKYQTSRNGLKARLARQVGRWIEKWALAQADGIVSVSRGYVDDLLSRNPRSRWASGESSSGVQGLSNGGKLERVLVQPFPADERGLEMVEAERRETGKKRIVYVGAGGVIMEKGWRKFLAHLQKEPLAQEVGIEIYGTDPFWKEGERRYLQSIAEEMGLKGLVMEEPKRVSYERSLALVKGADGLLVLGVDDPNYQPSKLHTYLATGLPVIVLARLGSSLPKQLKEGQGTRVLCFHGQNESKKLGNISDFFKSVKNGKHWPKRPRLSVLEAWSHQLKFLEKII